MAHWREFDFVVINDDLDRAVAALEAILSGRGQKYTTRKRSVRIAVAGILGS
jgi:guanylate kinase